MSASHSLPVGWSKKKKGVKTEDIVVTTVQLVTLRNQVEHVHEAVAQEVVLCNVP